MTNEWILLPCGVVAGVINAVAGGGSLLTFPAFLAIGFSPYAANITNAVGIFPSNIGGVIGYRQELRRSRREMYWLAVASCVGALCGAVLLLQSGANVFHWIAPWLILLASVLMLAQPIVVRWVVRLRGDDHFAVSFVAVGVVAVYGGYFGAGMGVMFLAVFGAFVHDSIQRINALKNWFALCANAVCLVVFGIFAHVVWQAAAFMAAGSLIGGIVGSHVAIRLPERMFRFVVVAIGMVAAVAVAIDT